MKDFFIDNNYLFDNIYEVDEVIRIFGNRVPEELKEFKIIRSHFCFHINSKGIDEKEEISEEEYLKNKDNTSYFTKLNYQDFKSKFMLEDFCHFLDETYIIDLESSFLLNAKEYINSSNNVVSVKSRLKDVLDTLKYHSTELKNITCYWNYNVKINKIQENVINTFTNSYIKTHSSLMLYYSKLVSKDFFNNSLPIEKTTIDKEINPYPRIFKDYKAYKLFENLKDNLCLNERTALADYSFVFRILYKDKYIYDGIQESEFRNFLLKNYNVSLDKLKTLDNCSPLKKTSIYNLLK